MEAVAKALLTAKEEVFITDWWLSPEVMLIRPTDDETYRLDNILGRIAVRLRSIFISDAYFKLLFFCCRMRVFVFMLWYLKKCHL